MAKKTNSLISSQLLKKIGAWESPIFMVDRIIDFKPGEKGYIKAIKHVSFNEPFIAAHFKDNPVMPGVMTAEIFGQASEYFSLFNDYCCAYEKNVGKKLINFGDVYQSLQEESSIELLIKERKQTSGFLAAQDVKFKYRITPGDTIEVTSRLAFFDQQGFYHYEVEAYVGRHLASHGKIINFRHREKSVRQDVFSEMAS